MLGQGGGVSLICRLVEEDEADQHRVRVILQKLDDGGKGGPGSLDHRIAVRSGRQGREGDAPALMGHRHLQTAAVGGGQQSRLTLGSAAPDRTHGMDDESAGEVSGCRDDGTTSGASFGIPAAGSRP